VSERVVVLGEPDTLRGALAPLRRRLLQRLADPASASELAVEFGMSRQKLNYHLRKLEETGLVEVVARRQRRGFVERVLQAKADAYLIDPGIMSAPETGQGPTFAWETEVHLDDPHRFSEALAGAMAAVVERFDSRGTPGSRAYRLVSAGHPARGKEKDDRAA
jgi:DNA-binding transcriptional ArsR family regulator